MTKDDLNQLEIKVKKAKALLTLADELRNAGQMLEYYDAKHSLSVSIRCDDTFEMVWGPQYDGDMNPNFFKGILDEGFRVELKKFLRRYISEMEQRVEAELENIV